MAPFRLEHDLRIDPPWSIGERSGVLILVILVPTILVLDLVAGRGFSLQLFYLLPITLGAWVFGERAGYLLAAATGISCAVVAVGTRGPYDSPLAAAWEIASTFALFAFVAHLVARQRRFVEAVRAHARLDPESGALSRREFDRSFEDEVRRARRYRRPVALVVLDLGDTKGRKPAHLAAVTRTARSLVREGDAVARITGRRFALVLVECHSQEALEVADRLRAGLANLPGQAGQPIAIGFATYGGASPTAGVDLLRIAERDANLDKRGTGLDETHIP